jgi:hypothetical protein
MQHYLSLAARRRWRRRRGDPRQARGRSRLRLDLSLTKRRPCLRRRARRTSSSNAGAIPGGDLQAVDEARWRGLGPKVFSCQSRALYAAKKRGAAAASSST